ncbi:MAG TPA: hypothetical protein VIZ65_00415 [Cellvibrionaceae bacterium]
MPAEHRIDHIKSLLGKVYDGPYKDQLSQFAEIFISGIDANERQKVVVLVHGIRTQGNWFDTLERRISSLDGVEVHHCKYGFFNSLKFIFSKNWRKTAKEAVLVNFNLAFNKPENRNKDFYLIAHSFGTYLSAEILKDNPHFQFDKIIFCGSVVSENYRWDTLKNGPRYPVINECGTNDFYPILAKGLTWTFGASGTTGFHYAKNRYHDFQHSDFFADDFYEKFWIPFITEGEHVPSNHSADRPELAWRIQILSETNGSLYYALLGAIILLAVIIWIIWTIYKLI